MTSTTTESHEEYVNSPVLLSMRILTRWLVYNDEQCVKTPINVLCYLLEKKRKTRYAVNTHTINPLKPELNPICYLLALLGAHHFLNVSRIRVKLLTFR